MKIIKVIWGVIVIIWLAILSLNLSMNIEYAESAMQASQLYDQATTTILRIIAITLVLNLWNESTKKSTEQIQQQAKDFAEHTKLIADVLDRLEQRMESSITSNTAIPKAVSEVEQTDSAVSPKLEQSSTTMSDNHPCPKCHAPMLIRTVTKGEHQGKQFYVCSNYPKCREVLPV